MIKIISKKGIGNVVFREKTKRDIENEFIDRIIDNNLNSNTKKIVDNTMFLRKQIRDAIIEYYHTK